MEYLDEAKTTLEVVHTVGLRCRSQDGDSDHTRVQASQTEAKAQPAKSDASRMSQVMTPVCRFL
jgi:hypothetical protein